MKSNSTVILAIVSVLLAVVLFWIKHSDNAQMASDAGTIVDYSNRLDTAQMQIAERNGSLINLSNILAECASASLTLSNRLTETQSTVTQQSEHISDLTRQVATATSENQALNQRVMNLTNQLAGLSSQLAQTQTNLDRTAQDLAQSRKDYSLLDNRFRRDVAERLVVARKFYNASELRAQLEWLKRNPETQISTESIYKSFDVEVKTNGAYVIAPN